MMCQHGICARNDLRRADYPHGGTNLPKHTRQKRHFLVWVANQAANAAHGKGVSAVSMTGCNWCYRRGRRCPRMPSIESCRLLPPNVSRKPTLAGRVKPDRCFVR
jgi:hypothetical protein